jgi:hypothetical protein
MGTEITKRALTAGFGVGALALLSPRAEADVPFSNFAFPAAGTPTARTMPERLAEKANVKDFGARGNGSADDTQAIQAAVNKTPSGGLVYFPPGTYRTTAPIRFNEPNSSVHFRGCGDTSLVTGNFAGFIFDRTNGNGERGGYVFEGLKIVNSHPRGGGVRMLRAAGATFLDCQIYADVCIDVTENTFAVGIRECDIRGRNYQTSIGILTKANQCVISGSDIVGCLNGIRAFASGTIVGCRIEMCVVGAMLGMDAGGGAYSTNGVLLTSTSFEGCDTGIYAYHLGTSQISAVSIQGQPYAPQEGGGQGRSHYGVRVRSIQDSTISALTANWGFQVAGISFRDDVPPVRTICMAVNASSWQLPSNQSGLTRIQCA